MSRQKNKSCGYATRSKSNSSKPNKLDLHESSPTKPKRSLSYSNTKEDDDYQPQSKKLTIERNTKSVPYHQRVTRDTAGPSMRTRNWSLITSIPYLSKKIPSTSTLKKTPKSPIPPQNSPKVQNVSRKSSTSLEKSRPQRSKSDERSQNSQPNLKSVDQRSQGRRSRSARCNGPYNYTGQTKFCKKETAHETTIPDIVKTKVNAKSESAVNSPSSNANDYLISCETSNEETLVTIRHKCVPGPSSRDSGNHQINISLQNHHHLVMDSSTKLVDDFCQIVNEEGKTNVAVLPTTTTARTDQASQAVSTKAYNGPETMTNPGIEIINAETPKSDPNCSSTQTIYSKSMHIKPNDVCNTMRNEGELLGAKLESDTELSLRLNSDADEERRSQEIKQVELDLEEIFNTRLDPIDLALMDSYFSSNPTLYEFADAEIAAELNLIKNEERLGNTGKTAETDSGSPITIPRVEINNGVPDLEEIASNPVGNGGIPVSVICSNPMYKKYSTKAKPSSASTGTGQGGGEKVNGQVLIDLTLTPTPSPTGPPDTIPSDEVEFLGSFN